MRLMSVILFWHIDVVVQKLVIKTKGKPDLSECIEIYTVHALGLQRCLKLNFCMDAVILLAISV